MRNFKFLTKPFEGKNARPVDIKKFGLDINTIDKTAIDFNELRKSPPNIVIAECTESRKFSQDKASNQSLVKGNKYGMGLGVFQQLWWDSSSNVKILRPTSMKFIKMYRPYTGQNLDNKSLVVMRTGGIGDLLFIQPNLIYLKEKYPTSTIILSCGPQYQSMVDNWDCIDELCDLPIYATKLAHSHYHAIFEGVIERCALSHHINAYRLFTDWLGINLPNEKLIPHQVLKPERLEYANNIISQWNLEPGSFVLMLLRASSPIRTPRPEFWKALINELNNRGYKVVITDAPYMKDQIEEFISTCNKRDMIFNFSEHSRLLDYSIALTSLAKGCISTDTSLTHIAASLNIPSFGIFGPFPGEIRLSTYPKARWINSECSCAPCFLHGTTPCKNAIDGHSICYDSININDCINKFEELVNND